MALFSYRLLEKDAFKSFTPSLVIDRKGGPERPRHPLRLARLGFTGLYQATRVARKVVRRKFQKNIRKDSERPLGNALRGFPGMGSQYQSRRALHGTCLMARAGKSEKQQKTAKNCEKLRFPRESGSQKCTAEKSTGQNCQKLDR